jgi:hypothetical protein
MKLPPVRVRVFLSYRRAEAEETFVPGRLAQELGHRFGKANVFLDVTHKFTAGCPWRPPIQGAIAEAAVLLVLIGPNWEPSKLFADDDPVAFEIQEAVRRQKRIIPILIGNTPMPSAGKLPKDIQFVTKVQAPHLRSDPYFDEDFAEIADAVRRAAAPPSVLARMLVDRLRRRVLASVTVALVLLVILIGFMVWPDGDDTITVSATEEWVNTGLDLTGGDIILVEATGTIDHGGGSIVTPAGNSAQGLQVYNRVVAGKSVGGNHAGLIASIDKADAVFVGSMSSLTAPASGRLFLGVNDAVEGLEGNHGHFKVKLEKAND